MGEVISLGEYRAQQRGIEERVKSDPFLSDPYQYGVEAPDRTYSLSGLARVIKDLMEIAHGDNVVEYLEPSREMLIYYIDNHYPMINADAHGIIGNFISLGKLLFSEKYRAYQKELHERDGYLAPVHLFEILRNADFFSHVQPRVFRANLDWARPQYRKFQIIEHMHEAIDVVEKVAGLYPDGHAKNFGKSLPLSRVGKLVQKP